MKPCAAPVKILNDWIIEVKYTCKGQVFLLGKGEQIEGRVIEDGRHCYDDLIRVYVYQHSPPMPKTNVWGSNNGEDEYQYLQ